MIPNLDVQSELLIEQGQLVRSGRVMEDLQARHRKEQRDLQARITQKKKSATKKTRKGVNDECAEFERQLFERQQGEIAAHGVGSVPGTIDESGEDQTRPSASEQDWTSGTSNSSLPECRSHSPGGAARGNSGDDLKDAVQGLSVTDTVNRSQQNKKPNRQKARLAKRAAEKEALAAEAAQEATALPDLREMERAAMLEEFERYGLKEKDIRPDGHCLYSAVADQLKQIGVGLMPHGSAKIVDDETTSDSKELADYKIVRYAAADYIALNPDDFIPFLEEPLDDYTHKIKDTAEWGGQLELLALAKAYRVEIHVLQSASSLEKIVPDTSTEGRTIWLAYYRHNYGLGEHYNSLRKAP